MAQWPMAASRSRRTQEFLARSIDQALGREPADLVIKNARFLNIVTGEIAASDIAICGDAIVGTYAGYKGKREIDGRKFVCVPGFVDTHVHVEFDLVTPFEFDRCALPRGTTTAICDPHEITNVLGTQGLDYVFGAAANTAMDLRVQFHRACRRPRSRPRARDSRPPTCCPIAIIPAASAWPNS